jgi:hypothetical protein
MNYKIVSKTVYTFGLMISNYTIQYEYEYLGVDILIIERIKEENLSEEPKNIINC